MDKTLLNGRPTMRHIVPTILIVVIVFPVSAGSRSARAGLSSWQSILEKHERNRWSIELGRRVVSSTLATKVIDGDNEPMYDFRDAEARFDDKRVQIIYHSWASSDKRIQDRPSTEPYLSGNMIWPFRPDIVKVSLVRYDTEQPPELLVTRVMASGEDTLTLFATGIRERLYGFLNGEKESLGQILRGADNAKQFESVPDASTVTIEATGNGGRYTAVFDMTHGACLVRLSVFKGPGNTFQTTRKHLSDPDPALLGRGEHVDPAAPEYTIAKYEAVLDDVKLERIGSAWCPTSATITMVETYKDGHTRKLIESVTQRVDLNPRPFDEIHAFELGPIPDGTPVIVRGNRSGIRYEWRDDKIQTVIDRSAEEQQRGEIERHGSAFGEHTTPTDADTGSSLLSARFPLLISVVLTTALAAATFTLLRYLLARGAGSKSCSPNRG